MEKRLFCMDDVDNFQVNIQVRAALLLGNFPNYGVNTDIAYSCSCMSCVLLNTCQQCVWKTHILSRNYFSINSYVTHVAQFKFLCPYLVKFCELFLYVQSCCTLYERDLRERFTLVWNISLRTFLLQITLSLFSYEIRYTINSAYIDSISLHDIIFNLELQLIIKLFSFFIEMLWPFLFINFIKFDEPIYVRSWLLFYLVTHLKSFNRVQRFHQF
jgi:hypothetical protein